MCQSFIDLFFYFELADQTCQLFSYINYAYNLLFDIWFLPEEDCGLGYVKQPELLNPRFYKFSPSPLILPVLPTPMI